MATFRRCPACKLPQPSLAHVNQCCGLGVPDNKDGAAYRDAVVAAYRASMA